MSLPLAMYRLGLFIQKEMIEENENGGHLTVLQDHLFFQYDFDVTWTYVRVYYNSRNLIVDQNGIFRDWNSDTRQFQ